MTAIAPRLAVVMEQIARVQAAQAEVYTNKQIGSTEKRLHVEALARELETLWEEKRAAVVHARCGVVSQPRPPSDRMRDTRNYAHVDEELRSWALSD